MAGARQGQTNNNRRAAESNWQFVIFIASTPLHPKRGIISRDESRGKSIGRDCEASVPLPSPSVLESSADFLWLYLPAPSHSLHFTSFFFTYDSVSRRCPLSGCLALALLDAATSYLAYFPLCGEHSHLSKNGLQSSSTADWRLRLFIGSQPSLSPPLLPQYCTCDKSKDMWYMSCQPPLPAMINNCFWFSSALIIFHSLTWYVSNCPASVNYRSLLISL